MHGDETFPLAASLFGAELEIGAQVGPYVVEGRGRRGGFATVYRVSHYRDAAPPAALKVLHQSLCTSSKMLQRFEREIEMLRRLRHPNIVEVIDCGALPDGRSYYVMPWVEGTPLDELLASHGAFSLAEVLAMFEHLVDALRAAHERGMVHRDLKPANMVVTPAGLTAAGGLCLLDFGIAKVVTDDGGRHDLTSTGTYVGTPHYMAPEQIGNDNVDARTDIYALGILLFQLVTGRLPFDAPTPLEIEVHHLHTPPPRPSDFARVPPGFDAVVACCLAKSPDARFSSVDELAKALRGAAAASASEPVEATHATITTALHVELTTLDALLALDDTLDLARELCGPAGWAIAMSTGRSFLALSPGDAGDAVTFGLRIVTLATADVRVTVTIHRASAVCDAGGELVGGDLACLVEWIAPPHQPGVWVTPAVLELVADRYVVEANRIVQVR